MAQANSHGGHSERVHQLSPAAIRFIRNHPNKFKNGTASQQQYLPNGGVPGGQHHQSQGNASKPDFATPAAGYTGLQGIMDYINQNGLNADQFQHLSAGYTGGNGYGVGGLGSNAGLFAGLSPDAVHYLATSGLLKQDDYKQNAAYHDEAGLTGDALFQQHLINQGLSQQAQKYHFGGSVNTDLLSQLFGMTKGGGYAKGYNSTGADQSSSVWSAPAAR